MTINVERKILLNPGPSTTTDTVKEALIVPDICPREKEFGAIMQDIRENLVKIVGGGDNYTSVLFGGSGTAAMEATICSVISPIKKILIINNGAYGTRMIEIAKTYNIPFIELKFDESQKIDSDRIKQVLEWDKHIGYVAVVHHETTTGILNPIEEIGKLAKENNCVFIVDTISSFAGVPFGIKECNIDFMISTSNKCIQGMAGVAFVICKKSELEKIKEYTPKSFYLDLYTQYKYLEETGQTRFTPPVQVIYALKQAIKEFFDEGVGNRYNRYKRNYLVLTKGLSKMGFKFLLKDDVEHSQLLTTVFEPDDSNFSFDVLHDKLYEKGFTIYPGKLSNKNTFRIAVMGAIDHKDIEKFLSVLRDVLKEMSVKLKQ